MIGPPIDGLKSQIFSISPTLVSVLFGLNVVVAGQVGARAGWPMPASRSCPTPSLRA